MNRKFYEAQRSADVKCAMHVLAQARKHRQNGEYHADLMQTVRLHIDAVRYFDKRLKAYN